MALICFDSTAVNSLCFLIFIDLWLSLCFLIFIDLWLSLCFLVWWISHSHSLSIFVDQFSQFFTIWQDLSQFSQLMERSLIILWLSLPFPRGPFVLSPFWEMREKVCGPTSSQKSTRLVCVKLLVLACPALACPTL